MADQLLNFSDSDDEPNVFEMINTEKARQAIVSKLKEEAKLGGSKKSSTQNGNSNGQTETSETVATGGVQTKQAKQIPRQGSKTKNKLTTSTTTANEEESSAKKQQAATTTNSNNKNAVNGVTTAASTNNNNRKIILKRFSNGSNSDDDDLHLNVSGAYFI